MAKFSFTDVLNGIAQAAPILTGAPALFGVLSAVVDTFDGDDDQDTLKQALADARADNDEGHARLQAKLAEAARRG